MKKITILLILLFFLFSSIVFGQTMYVAGQIDGDWGDDHQMNTETLDAEEYFYYTINATNDYTDAKFLFQSDVYYNRWNDVTTNVDEVKTYIFHNDHGGDDNVIDSDVTDGNHYTFRLENNGYSNSKGLVMETSNAPITISSVNQIGDDIEGTHYLNSNEDQNINIGLSDSKSAEEKIYLRYTTDSWSTDNFIEASGSGVDYSATIPGQTNGINVEYYVLTTTLSYSEGNDLDNYTDLVTLKYNNNSSNNYSYTVDNYKTYHPISIDGTNDFSMTNERFETTSGTDLYGYLTWDSNNLYFGFSGNSPAGTVTDADRVYHIYIDTDPQTTPTSGTGTADGENSRWDPTLPFTANYHYSFKTSDNTETRRTYSTSWIDATFSTSNHKASGFWELSIDLSDLGSPSQIYLAAYVEEDWDSGSICGGMPDNLFTNTSTQGAIDFNDHWLGFALTSGETPNSTDNEDPTLPVELSSFTANPLKGAVELNWATESEIENLGFILSRKLKVQSLKWAEIASYTSDKSLAGHGSTSQRHDYEYTDTQVQPRATYEYRLGDVDYSGSVTWHDPVEITVPDADAAIPAEFGLQKVFPNPFNPAVTMHYGLIRDAKTTLQVYNIRGQLMETLISKFQTAGSYDFTWQPKQLSTGVYIVCLKSGNQTNLQKIVFVK